MANDYTPISMIRGNSTIIDSTPIVDGQILFDETRKCLFMDNGSTREKYSGLGADSNIANVEDTTTASQPYTTGEFVVVEGQLYKVTASIATGDTFSVGTNIETDTVGSEITKINADLSDIQTYKVNKPNKRPINVTNNMLNVALGDNNAEVNQPFYFSTDAATLTGLPNDAPTPFYGWREVQCVMSLTTVILHEMYPMYGRMWSNTYDTNQSKWLGWRAVQAPLEGKLVISKMYPVTFTNGSHSYTLTKPANYSVINTIPGAYVNNGYISDRHIINQASTTCVASCYSSAPTGSTGYINLIFMPSSIMTYE